MVRDRCIVRTATAQDAADLASIRINSWRAAYRGLVDQQFLDDLDFETNRQKFRDALKMPNDSDRADLICMYEGRGIAWGSWAACQDDDVDRCDVAEIRTLYVEPLFFGQGIGRLLMSELISEIRLKKTYSSVILWVLEGNERAIRFYRRYGFMADAVKKAFPLSTDVQRYENRYRLSI
ncbi:MAG: N-acetyltransferase [Myxococcota bacterium]|nr:N-acetyltransferase [Myxococcota bacterium]